MVDVFTTDKRSEIMARITGKNTSPGDRSPTFPALARVSVPSPQEGPSRLSRHRPAKVPNRNPDQWMLLARPYLQGRPTPKEQQELLEPEARSKQEARRPQRAKTSGARLETDRDLGL